MKKLSIMAIMAVAAITLASCNQTRPPKADVKTDIDSLSYTLGNQLANQVKGSGMLENRYQLDSTYYAEFLRGVNDAFSAGEDKAKAAYFVGLQVGLDLNASYLSEAEKIYFYDGDTTKTFSRDNFLAAFFDVFNGKKPLLDAEKMAQMNAEFNMLMRTKAQAYEEYKQTKEMEEKYGENRKAGEQFLEENKKKDGVQTTESGLQYKVLTQGTGKVPTKEQVVKVEYEGRLIDGTVFDTSKNQEEGFVTFPLNRVIPGWTEALSMMPVGSEWEIYIPQELAYGSREAGQIKPFSALIFNVKLLDIVE
ncbi:MAG: FKBP-type peptidyl-prolyl cis-trans isomerase [Prevotella sp.]|nr:FKBP-type peptidyl-prolyl cis-trans isomerase [Prevotella sp.]